MNHYIEAINTYLTENMPKPGCGNVRSLLDMLYCCYSQHNRLETADVKNCSRELDGLLDKLSKAESDAIFEGVCILCEAQKCAAFQEGILAGLLLFNELESSAGGCA